MTLVSFLGVISGWNDKKNSRQSADTVSEYTVQASNLEHPSLRFQRTSQSDEGTKSVQWEEAAREKNSENAWDESDERERGAG